jgi:hypothetical protein
VAAKIATTPETSEYTSIKQPLDHVKKLSPEELQRKVETYQAWTDKIRTSARDVAGEKLGEEEDKIVSLQKGRPNVIDGP